MLVTIAFCPPTSSIALEITREQHYVNQFIAEHHDDLVTSLRRIFTERGVPQSRVHRAINDTIIWEAECSLLSVDALGAGYRGMLLNLVADGSSVRQARFQVQRVLQDDLAGTESGEAEIERRLIASHADFGRCLDARLTDNGLPAFNQDRYVEGKEGSWQ
jgi:hypothetical protein